MNRKLISVKTTGIETIVVVEDGKIVHAPNCFSYAIGNSPEYLKENLKMKRVLKQWKERKINYKGKNNGQGSI